MKITKTKSGHYTTVISIKGLNGKRHIKRFTKKTRKELREVVLSYQTNNLMYTSSTAFCDSLRRYLDNSEQILSPATMRGYKSIERALASNYAMFMRTPVDQITQTQLQLLCDDLRRRHKSKTVRNFTGLISAVMKAEGYRMPVVRMKQRDSFDPNVPDSDVIKIVSAAAKGTDLEIPFALACMGLRRGEICAVTPDDFTGCVLHVRHSKVYTPDCFWEIKEPKTPRSDRYVPIPPAIVHLIEQKGCAWGKTPNALTCAFSRLLRDNGIEHFRLHDCRHFFASYCHETLKLSDAQIMKLGGWSTDYVMKRVYITALTDESEAVKDSIAKLLA